MSMNRIGIAVAATVGCLCGTEFGTANAAEAGKNVGAPKVVKPVGKVIKIEAPAVKKVMPVENSGKSKASGEQESGASRAAKLKKSIANRSNDAPIRAPRPSRAEARKF